MEKIDTPTFFENGGRCVIIVPLYKSSLQTCVICISNGLDWSLRMHRDLKNKKKRIFNLAMFQCYPNYTPEISVCLICLTLSRLVPSFIYVTDFPCDNLLSPNEKTTSQTRMSIENEGLNKQVFSRRD